MPETYYEDSIYYMSLSHWGYINVTDYVHSI